MTRHIFATRKGRAFRRLILRRDNHTCQMCHLIVIDGRQHIASAVVDHIEPIELAPEKALDPANCRTVCKACHDGPCQTIEHKHQGDAEAIRKAKLAWHPGGYDHTGRPKDPAHPWNARA